jgi:hypothetical protein
MDLKKVRFTEEAGVYHHPYISQGLSAERIADWLRAAEARRDARNAAEAAPARRHRRARRAALATERLQKPKRGSSAVGGRLSTDRQSGASIYTASLEASRAPSEHVMADRDDEQSGAAVLAQTRC